MGNSSSSDDNKYGINSTVSTVPDNSMAKQNTLLNQNIPNPFKSKTVFSYTIGATGQVELLIHSYTGQYITTLVSEQQDNGSYEIDWNTSDVASGIYYYTLRVDGFEWVKKAIKIK